MNKNSNRYIIIYSIIIVVVIAALLTILAVQLKPRQNANIRIEKMQNILIAAGIETTTKDAESAYKKYITQSIALNADGSVDTHIQSNAVFGLDLETEFKKPDPDTRKYPLYIATLDNGENAYIIPLRGKGLWGPIWGYIALESDFNTIIGSQFGHKSETPGLGAEISERQFQVKLIGKQIYDANGNLVSIHLQKGGADPSDLHKVDAISGGTLTSDGVSEMIKRMLKIYEPYFKAHKK